MKPVLGQVEILLNKIQLSQFLMLRSIDPK